MSDQNNYRMSKRQVIELMHVEADYEDLFMKIIPLEDANDFDPTNEESRKKYPKYANDENEEIYVFERIDKFNRSEILLAIHSHQHWFQHSDPRLTDKKWRQSILYSISEIERVLCPNWQTGRSPQFEIHESIELYKEVLTQEFPENEKIETEEPREKAPQNQDRINALLYFAPELETRLSRLSKSQVANIIHSITGVNKVDSYKLSKTTNRRKPTKEQQSLWDNMQKNQTS